MKKAIAADICKIRKIILPCIIALAIAFQAVLPVNAMTVYESDGNFHDEGYIFIGESHSVQAAYAISQRVGEDYKLHLADGDEISYEYHWDSSIAVTSSGEPNTFTMKGNLFFVFEGNNSPIDGDTQTNNNYIYSDGKGNCGAGVRKIHEIIDINPNIAHWNIISLHGAVSATKGTKKIADYYVKSYHNWISYEFPQADCYFVSIATMTKYYKPVPDKKIFNNTIAAAFPDKFFDYTDFYTERMQENRMIDTIHWDWGTYYDLVLDVIQRIKQKQWGTESISEYTVTDMQGVGYTNEMTVVYKKPSLSSRVLFADCESNLPVQITGVTSNGFFRICVGNNGADYYVAGNGLSMEQNNLGGTLQ